MNSSTATLIIYLIVLLPLMLLGLYFARRKMFDPHHKLVMTLVVLANWLLIAAVMMISYANFVAPDLPDNLNDNRKLIATAHGLVGGISQIIATYLVILMWTENTRFERLVLFRLKNIKPVMRATLALWIITVLMGVGVYATWHGTSAFANDSPQPVTTEEATSEAELDVPNPDTTEEALLPALTEEFDDDDDDDRDDDDDYDDDDDDDDDDA